MRLPLLFHAGKLRKPLLPAHVWVLLQSSSMAPESAVGAVHTGRS